MKRTELILQTELTVEPGRLVMVNRDGNFYRLLPGGVAAAGEVVVLYEMDLTSDADLTAANALFTADYYIKATHGVWPDEQLIINEFLPERGARVLEICCGAGRVAGALVRTANQVTAVDISEPCIRHAIEVETEKHQGEQRPAVDYRVGDALALPFADKSFDIGCCMENSIGALFSQRSRALSELVRVCKQRIVLGLRSVHGVGNEIQIYTTGVGLFEFANVHSLSTFEPFLALLPGKVTVRQGNDRYWGGREWFVIVDLGTES